MLYPIDLRTDEPRTPQEELGGVKLLARIIDKGRATITGTLGKYIFYDCALDHVFFDAIETSRDEFLDMLREAYLSRVSRNTEALADLREALASEPEVSDDYFLTHAQASDVDNAAVRWLFEHKRTPSTVIDGINAAVDRLPSDAFIDWMKSESP